MDEQRATNVVWQSGSLSREERWQRLRTRGATLWFTGLPASGKTTISAALEQELVNQGIWAYRLDGDNIRHGLNRNLGFSSEDRSENIRRIGEVAKLFADCGCVALTAFISPYRLDRDRCRQAHEEAHLLFLEAFVDAPVALCEQRDPKGHYRRARLGEIRGFTGVDDPYEPPLRPEITLKTGEMDVQTCVRACLKLLAARGVPVAPC